MLEITIEAKEFYNQQQNRFITTPSCTLTLEHSLISLAKWESKWHIPYLSNTEKTAEQELDYIRCMIIGNIPNEDILKALSVDNVLDIKVYIDDPMTATVFSKNQNQKKMKREVITAEVIYSRMFENNIPIECQKWHLNRLLTLIRVCDLNSSPNQKMTKKETSAYYAAQNAARRAKYNSRG
jgi:hypothetical protein